MAEKTLEEQKVDALCHIATNLREISASLESIDAKLGNMDKRQEFIKESIEGINESTAQSTEFLDGVHDELKVLATRQGLIESRLSGINGSIASEGCDLKMELKAIVEKLKAIDSGVDVVAQKYAG